jgi:predicted transcriptional regulator
MTKQALIEAKATTPAEQSDAIVVSFGADWHKPLLANDFSVVIRKRVPKQRSFKWIYFHINSPVSRICGRAPIVRIFDATLNDAVALAGAIRLSPAEIASYIGGDHRVGCYVLGAVELAPAPVSTSVLASCMKYSPPQSFFISSIRAKAIIDRLAGFAGSHSLTLTETHGRIS